MLKTDSRNRAVEREIEDSSVPPTSLALALVALVLCAPAARAQTDEIQVYDAEIAAPGRLSLTWHNNFALSGRTSPADPGGIVPHHALNGVPEWSRGFSDWLEAGLYLPVYTLDGDGRLHFDSVKLRALFVAPAARDRRLFYGVNVELGYNAPCWSRNRFAGEIRPIIGTHLGRFDLIVNPSVDSDFNGLGKLAFAPAARVAYHARAGLAVAIEHYADFGPIGHFSSGPDQLHTVFAVLDLGSSSHGLELGVGRGLTRSSDSWVIKLIVMHDL
jgi:hypothetical protein